MGSTEKTETKAWPVPPGRRGVPGEGGTKDLKGTEEKEGKLESEVTRVTPDGTASSEDPKERPGTSGPWVSPGETAWLAGPGSLGRTVATAEEDRRALRATGVVLASRAPRGSRGPEVHRVQPVPPALRA